MEKYNINVIIQPGWKDSFWLNNICTGLKEASRKSGYTLSFTDADALCMEYIKDTHPLVIGNNREWLDYNIEKLSARKAQPIIVNAYMIPTHSIRCSGVVFGIEEIIEECKTHLRDSGKTRTVLLGANPFGVTDIVKIRAFDRENVISADGRIEDCVADFIKNFCTLGCDSAICANDTAAICLVNELIKTGCRIPEDFAVIGIGNSYIGANLPIPLTSVDFDYTEMGEMAVRLFGIITNDPTKCRINVTLPCRLIKRATTGCSKDTKISDDMPDLHYGSGENETYFSGIEASRIIGLEAVLQSISPTDREILFSLIKGESCEDIAKRLFFTGRTVRYRITKLTKLCGCSTRSELIGYLCSAMGRENLNMKTEENKK